jgi:hypothetical protein
VVQAADLCRETRASLDTARGTRRAFELRDRPGSYYLARLRSRPGLGPVSSSTSCSIAHPISLDASKVWLVGFYRRQNSRDENPTISTDLRSDWGRLPRRRARVMAEERRLLSDVARERGSTSSHSHLSVPAAGVLARAPGPGAGSCRRRPLPRSSSYVPQRQKASSGPARRVTNSSTVLADWLSPLLLRYRGGVRFRYLALLQWAGRGAPARVEGDSPGGSRSANGPPGLRQTHSRGPWQIEAASYLHPILTVDDIRGADGRD